MNGFQIKKILKDSYAGPKLPEDAVLQLGELKNRLQSDFGLPIDSFTRYREKKGEEGKYLRVQDKFQIILTGSEDLKVIIVRAIIQDLSLVKAIDESINTVMNVFSIEEHLSRAYSNGKFVPAQLDLLSEASVHGDDVDQRIETLYYKALQDSDPLVRHTVAWCIETNKAYWSHFISPLLKQYFEECDHKTKESLLAAIEHIFIMHLMDLDIYDLDPVVTWIFGQINSHEDLYNSFKTSAMKGAPLEDYVVLILKQAFYFSDEQVKVNSIVWALDRYCIIDWQQYWPILIPEFKKLYYMETDPKLKQKLFQNLRNISDCGPAKQYGLEEFEEKNEW